MVLKWVNTRTLPFSLYLCTHWQGQNLCKSPHPSDFFFNPSQHTYRTSQVNWKKSWLPEQRTILRTRENCSERFAIEQDGIKPVVAIDERQTNLHARWGKRFFCGCTRRRHFQTAVPEIWQGRATFVAHHGSGFCPVTCREFSQAYDLDNKTPGVCVQLAVLLLLL